MGEAGNDSALLRFYGGDGGSQMRAAPMLAGNIPAAAAAVYIVYLGDGG